MQQRRVRLMVHFLMMIIASLTTAITNCVTDIKLNDGAMAEAGQIRRYIHIIPN